MVSTEYMGKEKKRKRTRQHLRQRQCMDMTTRSLHKKEQKKRIIKAIRNKSNTRVNRTTITKKQKWREKQL